LTGLTVLCYFILCRYNSFALPSLALLHRDVFQKLEEGAPLPDCPAPAPLQRSLSATAVQHLYGSGSGGHRDDVAIGSDDEVNQMAAPSLLAQHSLISLSEDWPSLDRVTTLDVESLALARMSSLGER
jgi:hypothetical protein